jgi:tetratricopeptide (TPR) repeat protein
VRFQRSLWFSGLFSGLLAGCAGQAPLPSRALELNQAGAQALAQGDLETADARFSVALEYSPHFVEALVNLGLVEAQRGNFGRARVLLLRARRLNADVAQVHHALGVLAERERRPDVASEHYREALAVDPGFDAARGNLARLLFDAGLFEDARISFKKLVEVAPDAAAGHSGLAESLIQLGRTAEAELVIERASRRFPGDSALALLRARSLLRQGQVEAARALLLPLAERRDEFSARALAWLGAVELARGDFALAARAARRALRQDPDDGLAPHVLARALASAQPAAAPQLPTKAEPR